MKFSFRKMLVVSSLAVAFAQSGPLIALGTVGITTLIYAAAPNNGVRWGAAIMGAAMAGMPAVVMAAGMWLVKKSLTRNKVPEVEEAPRPMDIKKHDHEIMTIEGTYRYVN